MDLVALSSTPDGLDRYARALRFDLGQKNLDRLEAIPTVELVLLLTGPGDSKKRVVVRIEEDRLSVSEKAADHYIQQAVVRCSITDWLEYLQTGAIVDVDRFDIFGSLEVLEAFLTIHRLEQRPVALRCQAMRFAQEKRSRPSSSSSPPR